MSPRSSGREAANPAGPGAVRRGPPGEKGAGGGGSFRAGGVRKGASLRHPALRNSVQAPRNPQELKTPLFLCKQLG